LLLKSRTKLRRTAQGKYATNQPAAFWLLAEIDQGRDRQGQDGPPVVVSNYFAMQIVGSDPDLRLSLEVLHKRRGESHGHK
jgi:hypothetical protein